MKIFTKITRNCMILFCAAAFVIALASSPFASSLPAELGDWRILSEHVTELNVSEELGKWTSASYVRAAPMSRIEVQLTEGPGPGALFVPESILSSDDGPIGFSSTYETLSVAGRRAVLENNSVTGQALAAAIGTRTVTFEARGISRDDLIAFAEEMIAALRNEK